MATRDLNLLLALDVLLHESSVTAAAERLHLSPSAMSRTLTRLRTLLDDPILVRAGQTMVPTPRAAELRERVRQLVEEVDAVLGEAVPLDLGTLARTFTIRANEGFIEAFGAQLLQAVLAAAPHVRLYFAPKAGKDVTALRENQIDLEIGVVGYNAPELRVQTLFRDRFVGVVRHAHPLASGALSSERYASFRHISVSRRGLSNGPIDAALQAQGLTREVVAIVPSFPAALAMSRVTDLVANVPERQTERAREGMFTFALPVPTEPVVVAQMWHPRSERDPAHRWLRSCVKQAFDQDAALR